MKVGVIMGGISSEREISVLLIVLEPVYRTYNSGSGNSNFVEA